MRLAIAAMLLLTMLVLPAAAGEVRWEGVYYTGAYWCDGLLYTRATSFPGARRVHKWIIFVGAQMNAAGDMFVRVRTDNRVLMEIGLDRYANPNGPVFYHVDYGAGNYVTVEANERVLVDYFGGAADWNRGGTPALCDFGVWAVTSE